MHGPRTYETALSLSCSATSSLSSSFLLPLSPQHSVLHRQTTSVLCSGRPPVSKTFSISKALVIRAGKQTAQSRWEDSAFHSQSHAVEGAWPRVCASLGARDAYTKSGVEPAQWLASLCAQLWSSREQEPKQASKHRQRARALFKASVSYKSAVCSLCSGTGLVKKEVVQASEAMATSALPVFPGTCVASCLQPACEHCVPMGLGRKS